MFGYDNRDFMNCSSLQHVHIQTCSQKSLIVSENILKKNAMIKVSTGTVVVTPQFSDLLELTCFQLNKLLVNHDI